MPDDLPELLARHEALGRENEQLRARLREVLERECKRLDGANADLRKHLDAISPAEKTDTADGAGEYAARETLTRRVIEMERAAGHGDRYHS
jgi:hypothetical protein